MPRCTASGGLSSDSYLGQCACKANTTNPSKRKSPSACVWWLQGGRRGCSGSLPSLRREKPQGREWQGSSWGPETLGKAENSPMELACTGNRSLAPNSGKLLGAEGRLRGPEWSIIFLVYCPIIPIMSCLLPHHPLFYYLSSSGALSHHVLVVSPTISAAWFNN